MQIDCDFEGGSIQVLDVEDPSRVELALRGDNASEFKQWFYFRVAGAANEPCAFAITDAGSSSFPGGWSDFRASASYDGDTWFRVPTDFEDGELIIRHTPEHDVVTYACFPPYVSDRHEALLERARASSRARVVELGRTVEGRPMSAIVIGDGDRPARRVWIIAHQHPGETMAGWFMEGIVDRMLDEGDPVAAAILDKAVLTLVPRMNPDGAARGNHRTNAAGRDLNREWLHPTKEDSPEVLCVRRAMHKGGVDLFLDIHGDEAIPYVFAFGAEGAPGYDERRAGLEELFLSALTDIDPDFQREQGYDKDPPGEADLRFANEYVAERFDCLSVGIEMPFKDNANRPDEAVGWSPDRCRGLARSMLEAILASLDALR